MPLLIPFILGAGATGYWWWSSKDQEQPSFTGELLKVLQPFLIIALILLALRWLYKQGSNTKTTKTS